MGRRAARQYLQTQGPRKLLLGTEHGKRWGTAKWITFYSSGLFSAWIWRCLCTSDSHSWYLFRFLDSFSSCSSRLCNGWVYISILGWIKNALWKRFSRSWQFMVLQFMSWAGLGAHELGSPPANPQQRCPPVRVNSNHSQAFSPRDPITNHLKHPPLPTHLLCRHRVLHTSRVALEGNSRATTAHADPAVSPRYPQEASGRGERKRVWAWKEALPLKAG